MRTFNYSQFNIGVEEEYIVIVPQTRELISHEQRIVMEYQKVIKDKSKG
jgi:carboxylate-amine ligase